LAKSIYKEDAVNNLDAILEVAIGLVAAWLTLSVAVSQIQEWISSWLGLRAKTLERAITSMLQDGALVKAFYNHPVVQSLSEPDTNRKPSYIQAADFASVMMDLIVKEGGAPEEGVIAGSAPNASQQIHAGIVNIKQKYPSFSNMLDYHFPHLTNNLVSAGQSAVQAKTNMENWYNSVQERASGWYKRQAMVLSFVIGLALALTFNIDSLQIATQLWKAPTIRQALVQQASTTVSNGIPTNTLSQLAKVNPQDYADSLALPIGWSTAPATDPSTLCGWSIGQNVRPYFGSASPCNNMIVNLPAMDNLGGWLAKIIGIILSGLAAAQGAPFWFNVLNSLLKMNMRGSGGASPQPASSAPTPAPTAPAPAPIATDGPVG
jgi:hypothetical protein